MKRLAFLLTALAAAAPASAGGHVSIGLGFVFPIGPAPVYYAPPPPPAYYYPAPVVVSRPAVTYVERRGAAPASTDFWYYCDQSRSYYPYVKTCPGGWKKVSPTPPG